MNVMKISMKLFVLVLMIITATNVYAQCSVSITSVPSQPTFCYGGGSVKLTASGGINFVWKRNGIKLDYSPIAINKSITESLPGHYTVTVRLLCNNEIREVESEPLPVIFLDQLSPGSISGNQSICRGSMPSPLTNATVATGSAGPYLYQWQSRTPGATVEAPFVNIPGATSATYSPGTINSTMEYRRRVSTNNCPDVAYTNTVTVTVFGNLTAGTIGTAQTIHYNFRPSPLTNATSPQQGNGTYGYQWESSTNNSIWTSISGAIGSSYSPPALTASTYYRRKATSCNNSIYTNPVLITVREFEAQMNYVITTSFMKPGATLSTNTHGLADNDYIQTLEFYDNLGRPKQNITLGGSPNHHDVVQPIEYDEFSREPKKYLPFAKTIRNGKFEMSPIAAQGSFYNSIEDIAHDSKPYSLTSFEASPLNRALRDYGPGEIWHNNSKYIEHKYLTNVHGESSGQEKIYAWTINNEMLTLHREVTNYVVNGGYYASGQLSIKSTIDEEGNETREYINKSGQLLIKKVYVTGNKTDFNTPGNWAETYYVYDDLGNLSVVIPPEGAQSIVSNSKL